MEEKVTLITKRKNTQLVFDYCMDLKIPFLVTPRGIAADEFEIDLTVNGIKQGVALGMFVKEHKFEVSGLGEMAKAKTNGKQCEETRKQREWTRQFRRNNRPGS
jgi:hypothetical protein